MSDALFPSGPWVGFYNYGPASGRHRMDLGLTFAKGRVTGDGIDDIGRFLIAGRFDAEARECDWTKTYPGSHDVFYRGFREGKGIWGTWEIGIFSHGGFNIWPKNTDDLESDKEIATEPEPVEAFGKELVAQPAAAAQRELQIGLLTEETVRWATHPRNAFPLPFGRGEGQGEGSHENMPTGRSFPLTPALSPSAGERENRSTTTVFCRRSQRLLNASIASTEMRIWNS